jgi:hypothetical protein
MKVDREKKRIPELNYGMPNPRLLLGRKLGKTVGVVVFYSYLFKRNPTLKYLQ